MTQLRGTLQIKNLEKVGCENEAKEADLGNKSFLTGLVLQWSKGNTRQEVNDDHSDVLEGLQPNSSLKFLEIKSCHGRRFPEWLNGKVLPCLERLLLHDCIHFKNIPCLPSSVRRLHLTHVGLVRFPVVWSALHDDRDGIPQRASIVPRVSVFSELHIEHCFNLTSISELINPLCTSLKSLCIKNCKELSSLPENFSNLSLTELGLVDLPKLAYQEGLKLTYTLVDFELDSCQKIGSSWFPESLEKLSSLCTMKLRHSPDIECLPGQMTRQLTSLKHLILESCKNLIDLEGKKDFDISGKFAHCQLSFGSPFGRLHVN